VPIKVDGVLEIVGFGFGFGFEFGVGVGWDHHHDEAKNSQYH
jgi:hypothetical protein